MEIDTYYSHLNGWEWLQVRRPGFWEEIEQTVGAIVGESCRTKTSEEKNMKGKQVYSPKELNKNFGRLLEAGGWNESRVSYWVTDDHRLIRETLNYEAKEQREYYENHGKTPIKSYNQTDFVKDRVAIEVQFGKYSFIAYDLFVKHLAFFMGDKIDCGVEILPMKSMQSEMSSGPGYYEGALYDLVRQGRGSPAVPLVIIGVIP